jgi:hypothetical protein
MRTYRYRLKFFVHVPGVIQHEERIFNFVMADGNPTTISSMDSKSISKGKEFVLSSGGYNSEEDALNTGRRVRDSLLLSGIKVRMGIDIGEDKANCWVDSSIKDMMLNEHGIKLIEDVHGLSVYSEEFPVKTFSSSGIHYIYTPTIADEFTSLLSAIYGTTPKISDKERLALELYGASYFEKSDRARFITLVLAVEALLEPKEREKSAKEVVDELIEYVKKSKLNKPGKDSIIGGLNKFYKESISYSLQEIAENYLSDREYSNMSSRKFIKHCYEIRNKLMHTGKVNVKVINIGVLASQLNLFISDLLLEMTEIRTV